MSIRIDQYIATNNPDLSRSRIQKLIEQGHVTVNGNTVKKNYSVQVEDKIDIFIPEPENSAHKAVSMELEILYEDKDLIAVNKPPFLSVHPRNENDPEPTLVNGLLAHCGKSLSGIGGVLRPGIVHRLDKETSGVILIAKTDKAHQNLSEQFAERTTKKWYTTLLIGNIQPSEGQIDAPIDRHPTERQKMTVADTANARNALTEYKILGTFKDKLCKYSLCQVRIYTGRTHQIRVHFQAIKYPVAGDRVYGIRKYNTNLEQYGLKRQFLHASKITFTHPTKGNEMTIEALLSADLQETLEQLERLDKR